LFEIEYFLEDANNIFLNDQTYRVKKNHVHICLPGDVRNSELPFKTKYIKFTAEGRLAEILRNAPKYFFAAQDHEATALLDEIITLHTTQRWDEILLQGKLLCFLSLLLKNANHAERTDSYKHAIAKRAKEYLRAHCADPIRLGDVAKAVNLSPNYFHTLFSEVCGLTPREYLEEYRINAAKRLLLTTQLPLGTVSEQCGFHTQQYLTVVFKTKVGCTPTRFRSQHQSAYFDSLFE
jgi:AraC-like DNA-binding protein